MGKKVLGIMVILLFFTGCQNMGNESENLQQVEKQENGEERNSSISNDETETNVTPENDQELSNGEHIRFQLGSQAKIDAIVDMPDKKWNEFENVLGRLIKRRYLTLTSVVATLFLSLFIMSIMPQSFFRS